MASSTITIRINLYWDRVQPDGSACVLCGDVCHLRMWRLFVTTETPASVTATDNCACDSCHQVLMEQDD